MVTFAGNNLLQLYISVICFSWIVCANSNGAKIRRESTENPEIPFPRGQAKFFLAFVGNKESSSAESSAELESAFKLSTEVINRELKLANDVVRFTYKLYSTKSLCSDDSLSDFINSTVIGIVGSLLNACTNDANKRLEDENITQISYLPLPSTTSKTAYYPSLLSVSPEQRKQVEVIAAIIKHYGWTRVTTIEGENSGSLAMAMQLELEAMDISLEHILVVNQRTIDRQLTKIKQSSSRVVVLLVEDPKVGHRVLRRAHKKGLLNKGWYWLVTDLLTVVSLKTINHHGVNMEGLVGVYPRSGSGPAYHQLLSDWLRKKKNSYPGQIWNNKFDEVVGPYVPQVYDAVYAFYKALQSLMEKGINMTTTQSKRTLLLNELKQNNNLSRAFTGATGEKVYFDSQTFEGPPIYDVVNFQDGSWRKVGWYGQEGLAISRMIVWSGGNLDPKYSSTEAQGVDSYEVLAVVMAIVMCIFLIMAVVLYRVVLVYREKSSGLKVTYASLKKDNPSNELISSKFIHTDDEDDIKMETNL